MNNILRMAFVAAVALVSANTFAQDADVTFALQKMSTLQENPWTPEQSLDGVKFTQHNITLSIEKGEGTENPIYANHKYKEDGDVFNILQLNVGNKLTLSSEKLTITKVKFQPVAKGNSPKAEKSANNYEMSEGTYVGPEGATKDEQYVWTGETSEYFLKNATCKNGLKFSYIYVWTKDGATGVESVFQLDVKNGKVYDLNGTYVGNSLDNVTKSGVYVVNGKKTVVKK